jgi:hypothetical protein
MADIAKRRAAEFQGEKEGNPLSEWLRAQPKRSKAYQRIETILKLLNEIVRIESEAREHHGWTTARVSQWRKLGLGIVFAHGKHQDVARLKAALNKQLQTYPGFPVLSHIATTGTPEITHGVASKQIRPSEVGALNAVLSLARQGLLDRMRQCQQCNRWFFARFQHQLSHDSKCRIKHSRSTEQAKEKHRQRMRDYYKLHKTKNVVTKGGK